MINQVVADREVNPLSFINECRSIRFGVSNNFQLIGRPNTTYENISLSRS